VLPYCSAVVTHGGHGTVFKALAAGVPLVITPLERAARRRLRTVMPPDRSA
jgi:UDP:flavonoid glycosyltransferase YjiC (YdhE family)